MTPPEKGVRSKIARITLYLERDVLLKSFGNLWQGSINLSFCQVDGHTMMAWSEGQTSLKFP
jgi:hypothetical protein